MPPHLACQCVFKLHFFTPSYFFSFWLLVLIGSNKWSGSKSIPGLGFHWTTGKEKEWQEKQLILSLSEPHLSPGIHLLAGIASLLYSASALISSFGHTAQHTPLESFSYLFDADQSDLKDPQLGDCLRQSGLWGRQKANWADTGHKPGSMTSMVSASVPALTSFNDALSLEVGSGNKSVCPQVAFVIVQPSCFALFF